MLVELVHGIQALGFEGGELPFQTCVHIPHCLEVSEEDFTRSVPLYGGSSEDLFLTYLLTYKCTSRVWDSMKA